MASDGQVKKLPARQYSSSISSLISSLRPPHAAGAVRVLRRKGSKHIELCLRK